MINYTGCFELRKRKAGAEFYVLKEAHGFDPDGNETSIYKMVQEAHEGILPDDIKYRMIYSLLQHCLNYDSLDEASEEVHTLVPIYNQELLAWVSSHSSRTDYCDEAIDEGAEGFVGILLAGYEIELKEVWSHVRGFIQSNQQPKGSIYER